MVRPIVENVAAAMPRLEALRKQTEDMVSLSLNVILYSADNGKPTVQWEVYLAVRGQFYKGATLDQAMRAAEGDDTATAAVPSDVVVPAMEDRVDD